MSGSQSPLEKEVAGMIVSVLALDVPAGDIAPEDVLFGEGLGLDSIDALELALEIEQRYGIEIRAEDEDNVRIFASLRALSLHIESNRQK